MSPGSVLPGILAELFAPREEGEGASRASEAPLGANIDRGCSQECKSEANWEQPWVLLIEHAHKSAGLIGSDWSTFGCY